MRPAPVTISYIFWLLRTSINAVYLVSVLPRRVNIFLPAILVLIFWSGSAHLRAQNSVIDSLKIILKTATQDTTVVKTLYALGDEFYLSRPDSAVAVWMKLNALAESRASSYDPQSLQHKVLQQYFASSLNNIGAIYKSKGNISEALEYYQKSLKIKEEMGNKLGVAGTLNNIGTIYKSQGNISRAMEYYQKSLQIKLEIGDKEGVATLLNNIGFIYADRGDIPRALEHLQKSLKIREEIGNKAGVANSLNNIGAIYSHQGDVSVALEYYQKSLKLEEESGNNKGIAAALNNIGLIYNNQGNAHAALEHYQKSLGIEEGLGNKKGIATSLNNIGLIYYKQRDFDKALDYHKKSLEISEELGNKEGQAVSLNHMGHTYFIQKKHPRAEECLMRSIALSKEIGFPQNIKSAAENLSRVYKANGKYNLALENYELFIKMRDSINNEVTRKASIKSQLKYEYEKQAAADSVAHAKETEVKNAELAQHQAEIKAKKNQAYVLFGGLGLVMVFAAFMFNRFKVTQKQKSIIEEQKEIVEEQKKLVEEKQHEILDSIRYAKRIQMAQIPSEKQLGNMLRNLRRL
jgi:tetratricopeptide (TPR) repeat protein